MLIDNLEGDAPRMQIATLCLYRFDRRRDRLWMLLQMGAARIGLSRLPGLRFWKLCGSGTGEGFAPLPNTAVWAVLAVWDNAEAARAIEIAPVFRRFRDRAGEQMVIHLSPRSARGAWSGVAPFTPPPADARGTGPDPRPETEI